MSVNKMMALFVAMGSGAVSYMLVRALIDDVRDIRQTSIQPDSSSKTWKRGTQMLVLLLHVIGLLLFGGVTVFSVGSLLGFDMQFVFQNKQ
jgi:hypothetical protein